MASLIGHGVFMNNTEEAPDAQEPEAHGMASDDPRMGFAVVTKAINDLLAEVSDDHLSLPTPCSEFAVKDLLDHMVMVMQRVATLGNGGHFSEVTQEGVARSTGHAEAFRDAAHDTQQAWTDPAKLAAMYDVPWGTLPGAPMLFTYTAELATHGWDLATAVGREFTVADDHLAGALVAAQMIPAEGRDETVPFDPVVDPGADAPTLLKIAGWAGRQVV